MPRPPLVCVQVMRMVKHSRLCGQAIISYLQQKGFPEVALHFVHDNKTRFDLALACGNIEVAMNTSYELNDDAAWHRLGVEALRQGNHQVGKRGIHTWSSRVHRAPLRSSGSSQTRD